MNGHGQWPPQHQRQLQQQYLQQQQQPQQQMYQQPGMRAAAAAAAGGGGEADVLPSAEELEAEAMKRGMPPLDTCLRRCPRCLQGIPIRR